MLKPYHKFIYGDAWFIRHHEEKLIPSKEALIDFIDNTEAKLYDKEHLIKMATALPRFGLPTNSNLILKGEHYEKAFRHLEYLSSSSTINILFQSSSLNEDDFVKWLDLLFYYLLLNWFTEEDCIKLLVYTPVYFYPSALLHLDHPRKRFEDGGRESIVNHYFKQANISLSECVDLANRFSYYGISRYITDLDCHPFLDYFSSIDAIKYYINKGNKKNIKLAGKLIGLYLTPQSIRHAIKQ